jgi:hypothetical protein
MVAAIFSEKSLLILLTLVGMAMCTAGIGKVAARGEWLHPMAILGYVIGILILLIVGTALFDIPLPLIDSTRAAIVAVVLLAIVKIALTQLHRAIAQGALH